MPEAGKEIAACGEGRSRSASSLLGAFMRTMSGCFSLSLATVVLALGAAAERSWAKDCPALLKDVRQLVVVRASGMNAVKAAIATYERPASGQAWKPNAAAGSAVVGLAGLAWGWPYRHLAQAGEPVKREGDKRTPMGIYKLGPAFGHAAASYPAYLRLDAAQHFCVDDVRSVHYGRIVPKATAGPGTSGEAMATIDIYRRGIVVEYPTDRAGKAGSCIFVHLWRNESKGTVGCVALPERALADLQEWSSRAPTAIAIVSDAARGRFAGCLPD